MSIAPCPCGKPGVLVEGLHAKPVYYRAGCQSVKCWQGPQRPTPQEAVEAWNTVVGRADQIERLLAALEEHFAVIADEERMEKEYPSPAVCNGEDAWAEFGERKVNAEMELRKACDAVTRNPVRDGTKMV